MKLTDRRSASAGYERPQLVEVGTLHELTLGCNKDFGNSDGFTFQGQSISCTSPQGSAYGVGWGWDVTSGPSGAVGRRVATTQTEGVLYTALPLPHNEDMVSERRAGYVPPALRTLGTVYELTLTGDFCWRGKELGGSDGFTFMGISVPISNCSP